MNITINITSSVFICKNNDNHNMNNNSAQVPSPEEIDRYKSILMNIIIAFNIRDCDSYRKRGETKYGIKHYIGNLTRLIDSNKEYILKCNIDYMYDIEYYALYEKMDNHLDIFDDLWRSRHYVVESNMFKFRNGKRIELNPCFMPILIEAYNHNAEIFTHLMKIDEINPNVSLSVDAKHYYAGYSLIILAMCDLDNESFQMILNHPKFDNKYQDCDGITPYIHVFHKDFSMKNYENEEEGKEALSFLVEEGSVISNEELLRHYVKKIFNARNETNPGKPNKRLRYVDEREEDEE